MDNAAATGVILMALLKMVGLAEGQIQNVLQALT